MHVTSYQRRQFWQPAVSCASCMAMNFTLQSSQNWSETKHYLTVFSPHFLKSNVQTFWIFGILGEKCWKEMVSDWKIFAHKGCKIAVAEKVFYRFFKICLVRLNIFLPPLSKVQCPNFLDFQNPWRKVMERSGLRFEYFWCAKKV